MASSERKLPLGVCIFREGGLGGGLAQLGLDSEPFEVALPSDLPQHVTWWTSLTQTQIKKFGSAQNPYLRSTEFLRLPQPIILGDLGLLRAPWHERLDALSRIFHQVHECTLRMFGWTDPPRWSLAHGIGQELCQNPHANLPLTNKYQNAHSPFSEAVQRRAMCPNFEFDPTQKQHIVQSAFRLQRAEHALGLLRSQLPMLSASWSHASLAGASAPTAEKVARLREIGQETPIIVEIRIKKFYQGIWAQLYSHGSGADPLHARTRLGNRRQVANMRTWVTYPELEALLPGAELQINNCYLRCDARYPKESEIPPLFETIGVQAAREGEQNYLDPFRLSTPDRLKYGIGLFLENLWIGLARAPNQGRAVGGSPVAAWLYSYDRLETLSAVSRLCKQPGYWPIGYSHGATWGWILPRGEDSGAGELDDSPAAQEMVADAAASCQVVPQLINKPGGTEAAPASTLLSTAGQLEIQAQQANGEKDRLTSVEAALCLLGNRNSLVGAAR